MTWKKIHHEAASECWIWEKEFWPDAYSVRVEGGIVYTSHRRADRGFGAWCDMGFFISLRDADIPHMVQGQKDLLVSRDFLKSQGVPPDPCKCDIKNLLSSGHDPNCPEKKQ